MSYNGSGTFQINTSGQPVVAGTVISSTAFNALTADLATGLSTAITKDGQTTATARIPFAQGISSTLTTDSSSVSTGSIITAGGVGIAKALYVGTTANIAGTTNLAGLTASSAVATDASKNLVSVTNTGTGNNVLATSPTLVTPILGTPASGSLVNCTGINYDGLKNRIINGAMVIDQRNAGASFTPATNLYTLDRWIYNASQASKFTIGQNLNSVTPPTGFSKYLGLQVASSVSIGTTDYFEINQYIEGFNTADLTWGSATASTVTLSFWVRSSLTGTFGGVLNNNGNNRSYPFSYTISVANTWEQKSITIVGDTTGTWTTDNTAGIRLRFGLGVGATYSGTAGAWAATGYDSATGATSVVGTLGATFYITGVQLEKGSTATSFDYRPIGTELQLCFRYCQSYTSTTGSLSFAAFAQNSTTALSYQLLNTPMRSSPTGSIVGATAGNWNFSIGGGSDMTASSMSIADISSASYSVQLGCASSTVLAGQGGRIRTGTSGYGILLSAEL